MKIDISNEDCIFCKENKSAHGFKNKWICDDCFDELYDLFKTHYYVKKVTILTNKIKKYLDKELGNENN